MTSEFDKMTPHRPKDQTSSTSSKSSPTIEANPVKTSYIDSNAMAELEAIFLDSPTNRKISNKQNYEFDMDSNDLLKHDSSDNKNENLVPNSNMNVNQTLIVNHSSSLNSNSSTSGYASGRSSPFNINPNLISNNTNLISTEPQTDSGENSQKSKIESMNSLIDDLIILNNPTNQKINTNNNNNNNLTSQFDLISSYFNPSSDKQQVSFSDENNVQTGNYSNLNYLMRRERSLDRCAATENFLENYNFMPSSATTANTPTRRPNSNQYPIYSNSTLFLNTTSSRPNRQHHRSNSILNASTNNSNMNPLNFTRDYGNSVVVGGGLRSSAKALSSNSIQRDPSVNSIKSLNQNEPNQSKINFIKDLQIRLMDMQKECYFLRCELDTCQQKLSSSMQSIKQFWSPELKRERQMRKEEQAKYSVLLEQYKMMQAQYQNIMDTYEQQNLSMQQLQIQIQQLQQEKFVQDEFGQTTNAKSFTKEKNLFKKTIAELEIRINTQKQSLNTKDETIKKLFQIIKALTNKNSNNNNNNDLNSLNNTTNEIIQQMSDLEALNQQIESTNASLLTEQTILRDRLLEEERKNMQLQQFVQQLQQQKTNLMSQIAVNTSNGPNLSNKKMDSMLTFLDSGTNLLIEANKDNKMKQLEIQIQQLQEELSSAKNYLPRSSANNPSNENFNTDLIKTSSSTNHSPQLPTSSTQVELLKTNEKFLKEKIEGLKFDLSRKETELQQLKTKFETCESKEKDLQHYLTLLKESIVTKDQQITMQQSEVNDLRTRLRDKETFIEKKNQQLQQTQLEKHQRDSDIGELRDQMDIKERKISVLNRKIDNLEEQLKDKEMQINTIRAKLNTCSSSMYQSNVIQSLEQKDKIIEKLTKEALNKSQTQSRDIELTEQIETLNISIKELNEKIELKNKEIQDYQNEIFDLKDEVESFKTQLIRKDSHVNSLEMSLTQKNEEIEMIEEKLQRIQKQQQLAQLQAHNSSGHSHQEAESLKKLVSNLQKDLQSKEIQIQQLTTELITLKELIDDFEEQKQVLKSKLEQQQIQFSQLENQFEQTTQEFEVQFKQQHDNYEQQIHELKMKAQDQVNLDNSGANSDEQIRLTNALNEQLENNKAQVLERDEQISKFNQRIKELEDALRESVSITAERELVFAQQKKKAEKIELDNKNLMEELATIQKSSHEQQLLFNRYQEELYLREEQLQKLEEEKVKEMNELLITKQEILLSTISEKDSVIADLECDRNAGNKAKIQRLMDEKDNLHQQLKELNEQRMKLMHDYMSAKDAKDKVKILAINPIMAHDEDGIYA